MWGNTPLAGINPERVEKSRDIDIVTVWVELVFRGPKFGERTPLT